MEIAKAVKDNGGRAYLVGGCVRDMVLEQISKDFDLEVYKLQPSEVEKIVKQFGKISDVGKSFGVLKLFFGEGIEIDVSLPRTDSKIGIGHKGFDVNTDPYMSLNEAASRRDFTINSMAFDPLTDKLYDPFDGLNDLNKKILRVTNSETFGDDPLRVLRALQFVARFELKIEPESKKIIQGMIPQLKELPKERIFEEWKKLLLKSEKPSLGLSAGMELGVFKELHPEFLLLPQTPQDSESHPEGDVWSHTLKCVDEAAKIIRRENLVEKIAFIIMLTILCHDLGKPFTKQVRNGLYVYPEHDKAAQELTKKFLSEIGADKNIKAKVLKLVTNHMAPLNLYLSEVKRGEKVKYGEIRRLATKIYPATIYELVLLADADYWGTIISSNQIDSEKSKFPGWSPAGKWLLKRAQAIQVDKCKPKDIIKGKDLIDLGLKPGLKFGVIIELANQLRDEKNFTKNRVIQCLRNLKNETKAIDKLRSLV
ncbi:MAG: CCA tRNA nucleotidyltransferase [Candidatus Cloacimonetes bacterium]|nr:CCA tRNA nucleotidyltransferase [Candidatus Cloacimonadota bacterium]